MRSFNEDVVSMLRGSSKAGTNTYETFDSLDDVPWPEVDYRDLYYGDDKMPFDSHKAIYDIQRDVVIAVASASYAILRHEELIEHAKEEFVKRGYEDLECKVTLINNGEKMLARFIDRGHPLHVRGDELYPTFVLKNSYDTGWAASVVGGIFRQICSNGAYIGHASGYTQKHVGNALNTNMKKILRNIGTSVQFAETKFAELANTALKKGTQLRLSDLKLSDIEKTRLLNMTEKSSGTRLEVVREDENKIWQLPEDASGYDVYNLMTEFVTHKVTSPLRQDALSGAVSKLFLSTPLNRTLLAIAA